MSWKPATGWEGKLKDITWSSGNEDVRFRHEQWRTVFEKQLESTPFSIQSADPLFSLPLGEEYVEFTQWLSPDAIWESSKPVRWSRRKRASGELMMGYICVVKSRGSLQGKDTKKKVLEATGAADVEKNENGELELHGRTYSAWSTAIPGAPLKSGG
ncbi:MAG: hypothetical protein Q9161_007011 [Pseudevernia consocians]